MVTIDDLKESLRAQLATLIDLYEAESSASAPGLREPADDPAGDTRAAHGPPGVIRTPPASTVTGDNPDRSAPGQPEPTGIAASVVRTRAIESCLQDFAAAIVAAEAADAVAVAAHGRASGMLQRAADSRAVALMMRRDAEKRLRDLALGRVVPTFEAHRLAEAQAAARISAALSRQSDADASASCVRARAAAQCAAIALAAACRADPLRVNAAYDPGIAHAARVDAQAAADRAGRLAASHGDPSAKPVQASAAQSPTSATSSGVDGDA